MKIDFYVSRRCNSETLLMRNQDAALADAPLKPDIRFHRISEEKALKRGLAGSPSVLINGVDILP